MDRIPQSICDDLQAIEDYVIEGVRVALPLADLCDQEHRRDALYVVCQFTEILKHARTIELFLRSFGHEYGTDKVE